MAERTEASEPAVRRAVDRDVPGICEFGRLYIPVHYTPLIGAAAAEAQVHDWWNGDHIGSAVAAGRVMVAVAEADGRIIGVGQRGSNGTDPVIYKLYLHPDHRGHGLGPRLINALIADLPTDTERVWLEHFAANERAASFYQREGFVVDHVEHSTSGNPALDVVWRVRRLGSNPRTD